MTSDQPWWLTMPPAELAARILPLFSSSTRVPEGGAIKEIVKWCQTDSYRPPRSFPTVDSTFDNAHYRAAPEAIQVLEHASLLLRSFPNTGVSYVGLTGLGVHALQTNTVRQHLGLAAPPT